MYQTLRSRQQKYSWLQIFFIILGCWISPGLQGAKILIHCILHSWRFLCVSHCKYIPPSLVPESLGLSHPPCSYNIATILIIQSCLIAVQESITLSYSLKSIRNSENIIIQLNEISLLAYA